MSSAFDIVRRYKSEFARDPEGLSLRAVAPSGERIRLRPLQAALDQRDPHDAQLLTEWRNRFRRYFLTDFTATVEQTERWLTKNGGDPSRILFMIEPEKGTPFGHAGLCNLRPAEGYAEVDNIIRGAEAPRGAMAAAVIALCDWATSTLGARALWVRVMADNPAVSFYEKVGFKRSYDAPLEFHRDGETRVWMERAELHAPAERYLRYMERAA